MATTKLSLTKREDYPTCDLFPGLTGKQSPRFLREAPGDHTHGEKTVKLAGRAGCKVMPWQANEICAINAVDENGRWVHSDAVLVCPRQNGKSMLVSLIVLYRVFVLHETVLFTAQQWSTAQQLWERTWELVRGRQFFRREVSRKGCSQGRGIIEEKGGGRVVFSTRSQDAGRGLTKIDLLIYDEAYNLTEAEMVALGFLSQAADDPQVFYMTTAVHRDFPQHQNGQVISGLRREMLDEWDPERPKYLSEYAAAEDLPPGSVEAWREANPSFGVISTEKKMREIYDRMNASAVLRVNFGIDGLGWGKWFEPDDVDDFQPLFSPETLERVFTDAPVELRHTVLAIDATPDRQWCSIAAGGRRADGGVHGLVGYHGPLQIESATQAVLQAVEDADPVAILIDPKSAAWVLADGIRGAGFDVTEMKYVHVKDAASKMLHGVDEGRWSFAPSEELEQALGVASLREDSEGGVRLTRTSGVISPLVAADFAMWGVDHYAPLPKHPVRRSTGVTMRQVDSAAREFAF